MLFGKRRNPDTEKAEPDYYLSVGEAASYLAGLQGRRPYNPGTIRGWLQTGELVGDQDDGGKWRVKLSELKRWASERGISTEAEEPKPAEAPAPAVNPDATAEIPAKEEQPTDGKQGGRFKLVPLDDEEDEDFAIATCPSCGAEVPVSSASVVVECPECGQQLQVLDDEDDADEDDEDDEPAPAPAAPVSTPVAPVQEVRTNPGFMGIRFGKKSRRG